MKLYSLRFFLLSATLMTASAAAKEPSLTVQEVIRIADQAAKKVGYDLSRFERPQAHYQFVSKDDQWNVFYDGKLKYAGNHFGIYVHDKSQKTRVFHGR